MGAGREGKGLGMFSDLQGKTGIRARRREDRDEKKPSGDQ